MLSDLMMAGMDGIGLLERPGALSRYAGHDGYRGARHFRRPHRPQRRHDYLLKPFEREQLCQHGAACSLAEPGSTRRIWKHWWPSALSN